MTPVSVHREINKNRSVSPYRNNLRRHGSPLPALGEDVTPSLPLGHLSDCTGLGCYAFGLSIRLPYTDYHWDCSFLLSWSLHQALALILVLLHRNLCYHCTIWSDLSLLVRYNLLQVQLSLVDTHLPSHSLAYLVRYDDGYLNCTSRTLGP